MSMEAFMGEMTRLMREEFKAINERLEVLGQGARRVQPQGGQNAPRRNIGRRGPTEEFIKPFVNYKSSRADLRLTDRREAMRKPFVQSSGSNPCDQRKRTRDIFCFTCEGFGHEAYQCPNNRPIVVRKGVEPKEFSAQPFDLVKDVSEVENTGEPVVEERLEISTEVEENTEDLVVPMPSLGDSFALVEVMADSLEDVFDTVTECKEFNKVEERTLMPKVASNFDVFSSALGNPVLPSSDDLTSAKTATNTISAHVLACKILCDVVPKQVYFVIHGRVWKHDRKIARDVFFSICLFFQGGR